MSVPDYQEFMLPLLRVVADRGPIKSSDYYEAVANATSLTAEDREQLLPSGTQAAYKNRIGWAGTYLVKAGLLERPQRGFLKITALGQQLLRSNPSRIDNETLRKFESFREFESLSGTRQNQPVRTSESVEEREALPPDEQLLASYRQLRRSLADDLLTQIKSAPPAFFEQLVVDLLVRMGYGGSQDDAGRAIGKSGDGGIDGIIKEDRLGLDFVYIQAKRWENVVGRPQIQGFAGSLEGQRARKGVFITTSSFTDGARDYVQRIEERIVLIDGTELASLMLDYGLGVTDVATYKVQRIDPAYFGEE